MDKKEQIIAIASDLFSKNGYENTPLSAICKTSRVSKGLISHHFQSKDGLLREIFRRTTELIAEMNSHTSPHFSPQQRLKRLLEAFFTQLEEDKLLFQFNLNMMIQPNTRKVLKDLIQERSSFILTTVKQIFDEIDKENSIVKSHMFIAELDGIALNYLAVYEDFPLGHIKKQIIEKYK